MCLISIVIPAYKAERFIGSLLKNISEQISKDALPCEVIVINDGSPDRTKEICESYSNSFNFISVINQENKGESGARNTGIEKSNGEYIYFLDSDDSIKEGSLKHFVKTIKNTPDIDFYCFAYTSTENGLPGKDYTNLKLDSKIFNQVDFLKAYLAKYLPIHVCSAVLKKEIIEQNLLRFSVGLRIGADIEWLLNVSSVIRSAYFSNRICYIYQIRNDSIMQGYKTYSQTQYHSFEIRRDIILSPKYQTKELKKYSNFWIENQLLSNIVYYLKSSVRDRTITNNLISDCSLLRRPVSKGAFKNKIAILIAKILPLKLIIKIKKG